MVILFRSGKLRKLCNEQKKAAKELGSERAQRLRKRLDQLRAAPNLATMRGIPGRCHELVGNRKGQISIDLDGPYRLIFEAAHDPIPTLESGGLDWEQVTEIRILEIEDTHE